MMVGCWELMVTLSASLVGRASVSRRIRTYALPTSLSWLGFPRRHAVVVLEIPLAPTRGGELGFPSVMSASVKPRLAGRQPSSCGGVPRVKTRCR